MLQSIVDPVRRQVHRDISDGQTVTNNTVDIV